MRDMLKVTRPTSCWDVSDVRRANRRPRIGDDSECGVKALRLAKAASKRTKIVTQSVDLHMRDCETERDRSD